MMTFECRSFKVAGAHVRSGRRDRWYRRQKKHSSNSEKAVQKEEAAAVAAGGEGRFELGRDRFEVRGVDDDSKCKASIATAAVGPTMGALVR